MKNSVELLSKYLKESNLTISSVESLTGGLFAASMTSISGASSIFKGGMVTYMSEEKTRLLGIPASLIRKVGVVSNEVGYYMAANGRKILDSDICVSFTGNAGPDAMEDKPVGLVYIGIAYPEETKTYECQFYGSRSEIRNQCIVTACKLILKYFNQKY